MMSLPALLHRCKRQIAQCAAAHRDTGKRQSSLETFWHYCYLFFSLEQSGHTAASSYLFFPHSSSITMREVSATDYALILRVKQ